MENKSKRPKKLRRWSDEAMASAFREVKSGRMGISAAAKSFDVPRMTLSDRVHDKVSVHKSKMGIKTALTEEEELALCNYISYMANRGFPLSVPQLLGFAWCIGKERGKEEVFARTGPSRKWWRGFKHRHPDISLRRPDALDRGRASLGKVNAIREYFDLLKETIDSNILNDKPRQIYNCDEAALYLNKSAGQKVIVPTRTKHTHSLSVATNEHISVHCCVNAAGQAIPPMIIYSKSLPGGAYHRNGPFNASYACSESGFMDQTLYQQWFDNTFLVHAVSHRPLLLIQDGASSHISVDLIRAAIANDVVLFCLPPKTTRITQPLDVAVYRKMKIETAKVVSQAKMIKSDLWISKNKVSSMFKVIYEKSFTMDCITEGFRKCGIFPFDPNAIDKSLLFRSNADIDPSSIDLSVMPSGPPDKFVTANITEVPSTTYINASESDLTLDSSFSCLQEDEPTAIFDVSFQVGEDGILILESSESNPDPRVETNNSFNIPNETQECPPELALSAIELSLTPRKKRRFEECYDLNIDLQNPTFQTWIQLKKKVNALHDLEAPKKDTDMPEDILTAVPIPKRDPTTKDCLISNHPLVKAGLIPDDLVNVLVAPTYSSKGTKKEPGKARVLTSSEVQQELEEKEKKKLLDIKQKEERKKERLEKKILKEKELLRKKEEMKLKRELREKLKEERLKVQKERKKQRQLKNDLQEKASLNTVTTVNTE